MKPDPLPQRASLFPNVCAHKTKRSESMAEEHMPFQENLSNSELIRLLEKQNKQSMFVENLFKQIAKREDLGNQKLCGSMEEAFRLGCGSYRSLCNQAS